MEAQGLKGRKSTESNGEQRLSSCSEDKRQAGGRRIAGRHPGCLQLPLPVDTFSFSAFNVLKKKRKEKKNVKLK